jgi:hypothetical protein
MRSIAILNVEGAEPDKAWGMALYSFREATKAITEMAKSPEYRDMAVNDIGHNNSAVSRRQSSALRMRWERSRHS